MMSTAIQKQEIKGHLLPQVPGHGSTHFWLRQACCSGQSPLDKHSGRHDGGLPIIPGKHEHTGIPFWLIRHTAFCPQKPQGSFCTCSSLLHKTNASPVYPGGQLQLGIWFETSQRAFSVWKKFFFLILFYEMHWKTMLNVEIFLTYHHMCPDTDQRNDY